MEKIFKKSKIITVLLILIFLTGCNEMSKQNMAIQTADEKFENEMLLKMCKQLSHEIKFFKIKVPENAKSWELYFNVYKNGELRKEIGLSNNIIEHSKYFSVGTGFYHDKIIFVETTDTNNSDTFSVTTTNLDDILVFPEEYTSSASAFQNDIKTLELNRPIILGMRQYTQSSDMRVNNLTTYLDEYNFKNDDTYIIATLEFKDTILN
ncbi:hypothetical protein [Peptoniphilus mikwangii]|uniref:hypothetical protein n=1 Tax=Peptoniphilus mikwangii TaxID=1354300 RepID=UPI0003F72CB6|nr:hypothetical protein [Peptoniphilus mikwangii]